MSDQIPCDEIQFQIVRRLGLTQVACRLETQEVLRLRKYPEAGVTTIAVDDEITVRGPNGPVVMAAESAAPVENGTRRIHVVVVSITIAMIAGLGCHREWTRVVRGIPTTSPSNHGGRHAMLLLIAAIGSSCLVSVGSPQALVASLGIAAMVEETAAEMMAAVWEDQATTG